MSNQSKVREFCPSDNASYSSLTPIFFTDHLRLNPQQCHIPRLSPSAHPPKIHLPLPRPGLRRRLQGEPKGHPAALASSPGQQPSHHPNPQKKPTLVLIIKSCPIPDPPKNLQIRRPTLRPRLPHPTSRLHLRVHLHQPRHRQSHPKRHRRLPHRHRRDRPPPPRRAQDKTPNQPRRLPVAGLPPHRCRRRLGPVPRRGLDRCPQRPWVIRAVRRLGVRQGEDLPPRRL
jgi:hypothetical protein